MNRPPRAAKTVLNAQAGRTEITRQAETRGLAITRRQPEGERGLSLWFDSVASPPFYDWITHIVDTYALSIQTVQVGRNTDGTVRVRITLEFPS